ncbi:MAG: hypothetical protein KDD44_07915, partial [Bdellovibrionales bacterium]|nr:hypothetical protein [Bdellovibrionales bacterium]
VARWFFLLRGWLWKHRPFLARATAAMGLVVVLLVSGLGGVLTFTHQEINITVASVTAAPGVVYERVDPPVSRETVFLLFTATDGTRYVVEQANAPELDSLRAGDEITFLCERIGRMAYTRWLGFMGSDPLAVNSARIREGT